MHIHKLSLVGAMHISYVRLGLYVNRTKICLSYHKGYKTERSGGAEVA
jgi:hypothetical protein